jgi:hypothetical protein
MSFCATLADQISKPIPTVTIVTPDALMTWFPSNLRTISNSYCFDFFTQFLMEVSNASIEFQLLDAKFSTNIDPVNCSRAIQRFSRKSCKSDAAFSRIQKSIWQKGSLRNQQISNQIRIDNDPNTDKCMRKLKVLFCNQICRAILLFNNDLGTILLSNSLRGAVLLFNQILGIAWRLMRRQQIIHQMTRQMIPGN